MTVAGAGEGGGLYGFVRGLFDGGVERLPAGFADWDPVLIVEAIVETRAALGPRARIWLNGWSTTEALVANAMLAKLDQARRLLPGARFDEAWQAIALSLDFATWGNEPWAACLLPNGAVLFRCFQQVLAVEEQPFAELHCEPEQLHAALQALAGAMLPDAGGESAAGSDSAVADRTTLLHRGASGLSWSSRLPNRLSASGQSLALVPEFWVMAAAASPEALPLLGQDVLLRAAAESVSGHVLIRSFQHRSFVHVLYDAGSAYDTLVEVHGEPLGPVPLTRNPFVSQNFRVLIGRVRETVRAQENQFAFGRLSLPTRLLAQHALEHEYAASKVSQMLEFVPLLGPKPDVPATAYEDAPDFSALERLVATRGRHLMVFVHAPGIAGSVDDYLPNALAAIERFLHHAELDPGLAMLRIDGVSLSDLADDDALPLSPREAAATTPQAEGGDAPDVAAGKSVASAADPASAQALPWIDLGDLAVWQSHGFVPLSSRRGLRALRRLQRSLQQGLEQALAGDEAPLVAAESEEELLSDLSRQLCLAVPLADEPIPSVWTARSRELALAFPSLAQVQIPCYGYVSGFSRGVIDSGNHLVFEADISASRR
jgi:hypothetical protein